jgi:hypothetical protein
LDNATGVCECQFRPTLTVASYAVKHLALADLRKSLALG